MKNNYYELHKQEIIEKHKIYTSSSKIKNKLSKYQKDYRQKNKVQIKKQKELNKEHAKQVRRNRDLEKLKDNPNFYHDQYLLRKQYHLQHSKTYREEHKEEINKQQNEARKNKRKINVSFKILCNLRIRLYDALKGRNKSSSTLELLGCSVEFLKNHLESKFTEGMNWSNYGIGGWVVDHIVPCASFDLSKPLQQRKCFHYTNLQPLWELDNLHKHAKILTT